MSNSTSDTGPAVSPVASAAEPKEANRTSVLVVVGAFLALTVSSAPLILSTQGIFMIPVTNEFGWDRGTYSVGFVVAGLVTAVALPFIGAAIDRWGVRRVLPIGVVLIAANLVLLSIVPAIFAVYLLVWAVLGATAGTQNPASYIKTVSMWFDRHRGLAIGLSVTGIAVGQAIVPQIAQAMVTAWGWRMAYLGLAGLLLIVALIPLLTLFRDPRPGEVPPRRSAITEDGASLMPGITVREGLRTRRFWFLIVSVALVAISTQSVMVHIAPLAMDAGWEPAAAAGLLGITGVASIVGRIGGGFLYDRLHAPYVGAVIFVLGSVGTFLLATGGSPVLAAALLGLTAGAETDLIAFLGTRYFGLRYFGQFNGYFFGVWALATSIGIAVLGAGYDAAGSYSPMLLVCTGFLVVAAILVCTLPRRFPFAVDGAPQQTEAATA
jgi:MFS family permease